MDPPKPTTGPPRRSSPPTPFPPLALSDFLSQQPFSSYDNDDDRVDIRPDTAPTKDEGIPSHQLLSENETTDAGPELLRSKSPDSQEARAISSQPYDPLIVNWQSKRSQLPPSRNIGKKGDWIRSWSEAVGVYGATAYCACSDTCSAKKAGERELKSRIRNILQRKTPLQEPPSVKTEPIICHNCSRPSSPAVSLPTVGHGGKMRPEEHKRKRERFLAFFRYNNNTSDVPSHTPGVVNQAPQGAPEVTSEAETTETTGQGSSKGPRGDRFIKRARQLNERWKLKEAVQTLKPTN